MTERYLGSIISPSPVEPSEGFADSTASGVWNVHDPLIFGQAGDWPDPTNASPSKFIENLFSCFAYDGTGSSQTITNGIDLSNEGGLIWIKNREATGYEHLLFDTERGATKYLSSDNTSAEQTDSNSLTGFSSTGFTLGSSNRGNRSASGESGHVSWTFRKQPKFFDVVTYSGTGSARTVSHNLGSVPGMILVKRTDSTANWNVYHNGLNGGTNPEQYGINLNATGAEFSSSGYWNNTAPTATEFTVGTSANANVSGGTYVAYLFAHNNSDGGFGSTGDQDIIKCGSYTGTGDTDGPSIDLGFEPQFVMVKNASTSSDWMVVDSIRGITTRSGAGTGDDQILNWNTYGAESASGGLDLNPDGFKLNGGLTASNGNGNTHIYMAIRRGLMKAPTAGTDVFAIDSLDGTPLPSWDSGFPVDMALMRYNVDQSDDIQIASRLTSGRQLLTSTNAAESSNSLHTFDFMTGWGSRTSTTANWYSWMFRRAPEFFDIVAYEGSSSAKTVSHNLGVAPEMIIFKNRTDAINWIVYHKDTGTDSSVDVTELDTSDALRTSTAFFNSTQPTSSVFTVGTASHTNFSGRGYIAYLFATVAGVSKVGSYSGTGSDVNVDCGFTSGARFVLAKRTDSSGDWFVWDTTNGIVAGDDPYLLLNTNAAQVTNTDYIDPLSSGFTITSNAQSDLNANGGTYLFLAIA